MRARSLAAFIAGVLVAAMLAPATALATHIFVDVPDGKFYAEAAKWAKDNDITTGSPAGSNTFKPEAPVTRGEVVTFLKRYHDAFGSATAAPPLGSPISNGCALAGRSSFDDWKAELSFANPEPGTRDAWIDWAIRDASGSRVSTEFSIIESVLAGESVSEVVFTLYDGPASSCDILKIEWRN